MASLIAAAGCRMGGAKGGKAQRPEPADVPELGAEVQFTSLGPERLIDAQRVVGMEFTTAERAQMLTQLDGQLALLKARRTFRPEWDLAPAHVFRPDLPGHKVPPASRLSLPKSPVPAPGSVEDVAFASLHELGTWLRRKEVSSVELTDLYLQRLQQHGPRLQCVVTATPKLAHQQARRADAELASGKLRGPLHGIPWGAKDLLDTRGVATTWGATPYRDRVATRNSAVVERLEAAGAVLVAKLSLGALAYGDQWFGGLTRNPWNPEEGSSGSSAGSAAAVVAGLVGFAIGSETLGSIVAPATRCGAAGFRPSFGRVSRHGAMALAWSLDKLGPLCRYARDAAPIFAAIDGPDTRDPSTREVPFAYEPVASRGYRVAFDPSWFEGEPARRKALEELGAARGVELVPRKWPELPWNALLLGLYAESAAALEELTIEGLDDQLSWQEDIAWPNTLRSSWFVPAADVVQADRLRRHAMRVVRDAFSGIDAWISPASSDPMLVATNYAGTPSVTVRAGFENKRARTLLGEQAVEGSAVEVPFSLTLWGKLDDDGRLLALADRAEGHWGVAGRRPVAFDA